MKHLTLFVGIIICITTLSAQESKNPTSNTNGIPQKSIERNGVTYCQTFYNSGRLRWEVPIINGKFHGVSVEWSEDGKIKVIAPYDRGVPLGIYTFYPNGYLCSVKTYNHSGAPTNASMNFHENAVMSEIIYHDNSVKNNKIEDFDSTGKPIIVK